MSLHKITLQIGGSREGRDYRFSADEDTLRRIAMQMLECLDGKQVGPWGRNSNVIVCEEVAWERLGILGKSSERAFLSFAKE